MSAVKLLLTGADGQVGRALQRVAGERGLNLVALTRRHLDITNRAAVKAIFREYTPTHAINAAAYTAVDRAEVESEYAFKVNRDGARNVAEAASEFNCRFLQISTDFVFDGKTTRPYRPGDAPNPLNVYGASKLAGERVVEDVTSGSALIVRTAWVYSRDGVNFLTTMLRLMHERQELSVVDDQTGSPTCARNLAEALTEGVLSGLTGRHHFVDAGFATWFDFACAIRERISADAVINRTDSEARGAPARRPRYSVLDSSELMEQLNLQSMHWRTALARELSP